MIKPWLLMTNEERKARLDDYVSLLYSFPPIDTGLLASIKPPDTQLGALFELWVYQQRENPPKEK